MSGQTTILPKRSLANAAHSFLRAPKLSPVGSAGARRLSFCWNCREQHEPNYGGNHYIGVISAHSAAPRLNGFDGHHKRMKEAVPCGKHDQGAMFGRSSHRELIVCLAMALRHEDAHFLKAMSCVTIISELNHQIRSTIFPLCLAAQRFGDKEISHLADEAAERINVALREANADAISNRGRRM